MENRQTSAKGSQGEQDLMEWWSGFKGSNTPQWTA
jgi:hypothetical protein